MVQQAETGTSAPEALIKRYDSNYERIRRHLQYNPDFILVGNNPLLETTNEYGTQDADFFVAPANPEFSVKKLNEIQKKLAEEIGIAFEPHFAAKEEQGRRGGKGMQFGIIRVKDPLFRMERQIVVTELEEGAAQTFGSKDGETKKFSGTIERFVFVRLYPHAVLAEIARYAANNKRFEGQSYHYLSSLFHTINGEQLDLFKRLSERKASFHTIKDALIAKELERDINEIARVSGKNITVGSRVSIDF